MNVVEEALPWQQQTGEELEAQLRLQDELESLERAASETVTVAPLQRDLAVSLSELELQLQQAQVAQREVCEELIAEQAGGLYELQARRLVQLREVAAAAAAEFSECADYSKAAEGAEAAYRATRSYSAQQLELISRERSVMEELVAAGAHAKQLLEQNL